MGVQVPPFAPTSFRGKIQISMTSDGKQASLSQPSDQPSVTVVQTNDYRDSYANSVQVRMSVWDFFLVFGTMHQESRETVEVQNFQGLYLSPQQAKALFNVLGSNLAQYEQTFGEISLEPVPAPNGPVH